MTTQDFPQEYHMIIGYDFLKENNMVLDCNSRQLKFRHVQLSLNTMENTNYSHTLEHNATLQDFRIVFNKMCRSLKVRFYRSTIFNNNGLWWRWEELVQAHFVFCMWCQLHGCQSKNSKTAEIVTSAWPKNRRKIKITRKQKIIHSKKKLRVNKNKKKKITQQEKLHMNKK